MNGPHVNIGPHSESIPFDDANFSSLVVADALREARAFARPGHVLYVRKDPGVGDFLTLKDALASIGDTDPRVIVMMPGVYVEDNSAGPLVLAPGVTVMAEGHSTVALEPSDPNSDLIEVQDSNCRIQGITIRNVTGAAAIRITESPLPLAVDFVTMSNCMEYIVAESSTAVTQAVLRNVRLISGSTTTKMLKVVANGFDCIVRIYSAILTDDNGTAFQAAISVTGTGARIDPNTALIRSTVGVGRGIEVDDGAHLQLTVGAEIHGFLDNLVFEDSGDPPTAQIQSIASHHGVDSDLRVIHTAAVGNLIGEMRRAKIFNAAPTTFLLTYTDPDNANFNNTGMLITRGLSPEGQNITTDGLVHQLTRFDPHTTFFLGSTAGTVFRLADATTFSKMGHQYDVWNFSSVDVAIQDYGGNLLATLKPNGHTLIVLRSIATQNGIWGLTYTIDNGNVFGTQLFYEDDDPETSNNSATTWVNKITLVTPALPSGDYLVQFQFNWRSANADRQLEFRVQRGGADLDTGLPFTGSKADRQLISGFKRVQTISGVQTFTLDFRRGSRSTTVYMYNARLFVWRVG